MTPGPGSETGLHRRGTNFHHYGPPTLSPPPPSAGGIAISNVFPLKFIEDCFNCPASGNSEILPDGTIYTLSAVEIF